jgi:Peptidase_C39 like family
MPGRTKILPVPYFTQPTPITCQSTVLKMMATYIEDQVLMQSTGAGDRNIPDIWKDINEDPARPAKEKNSHANMKWWLERHFPTLKFKYVQSKDEGRALESIVDFIDGGFPVLVSISHARVKGHIILVVGYENYQPQMSSLDFKLVVHDPYGRFDPSLLSTLYGSQRLVGGMSLRVGGEEGPGKANRVAITAVSRQRAGDSQRGMYYLISATR